MDKIGYRKVEHYEPNLRQWLAEKGEDDAGTDLFFHACLNNEAIYKHYNNEAIYKLRNYRPAPWKARRERQELFSKSVQQINAYHDAIKRGDIKKVVEYVPLDLTKESDRAYNRVQQERLARASGHL